MIEEIQHAEPIVDQRLVHVVGDESPRAVGIAALQLGGEQLDVATLVSRGLLPFVTRALRALPGSEALLELRLRRRAVPACLVVIPECGIERLELFAP